MKPIDFPEANRELGPPAGMEATCDPLNVLVGEDGSCMSIWEMDAAELTTVKVNGGRICVWVHNGNGTQPPIALTVPAPWETPDNVHLEHDSTNKGPTVRSAEAADLRMIIAAMRGDGIERVTMSMGLFERLVHTAETRPDFEIIGVAGEVTPLKIVGDLPTGVAQAITDFQGLDIEAQAAVLRGVDHG